MRLLNYLKIIYHRGRVPTSTGIALVVPPMAASLFEIAHQSAEALATIAFILSAGAFLLDYRPRGWLFAKFFVSLFSLTVILSSCAPNDTDASCQADVGCLGKKYKHSAESACRLPIEKLAINDYQWTDNIFDGFFSRVHWKDQPNGIVTYVGDDIKFQNGFGAWVRSIYECDFDTKTESAVAVRAFPGRLP